VRGIDVAALAALLGADAAMLDAEIRRAIDVASEFKWRSADLFNGTRKLRIDAATAAALALRCREFPGVEIRAVPAREVDPAIASIAGATRRPWETDLDALRSVDRAAQGLHVYSQEEALVTLIGSTGMEARLDERFRGVPGVLERPPARRGEAQPEPVFLRPVQDGQPFRSTLRREVQVVANEVVQGAVDEPAAAVVLDLADGAIVAAAGRATDPYFRPINPIIPGSVFKLVTAYAALEAGIDPAETLDCHGQGLLRNRQKYKCTHVHGPVGLVEAFEGSCNPYFMTRALDAGPQRMADAYSRLGMDELSGKELGIAAYDGRIRAFNGDLAQFGIGQSKALATPLQVATAYARLAARGRKLVPFVDRDAAPAAGAKDVDPVLAKHAQLLLEASRLVVTGARGTAHDVPELVRLDAAGKTGTADVKISRTEGRNNAWFVGFAPFAAPRYVAVVVRERVNSYGADVAGPEVARLLEAALGER
jgi:penicillin-binding protein 2